jgi:hypothetical protein
MRPLVVDLAGQHHQRVAVCLMIASAADVAEVVRGYR